MTCFAVAGLSDAGVRRAVNEDAVAWRVSQAGDQALLVVADGMGGYAGGSVASELAVAAVLEVIGPKLEIPDQDPMTMDDAIQAAFNLAQRRILSRRQQMPALAKMGTTLVLAWIRDDEAHIAHLGDSRCYLIRGGEVQCQTRDDTVVQKMLEDGSINERDVPKVPFRNVLTRALGGSSNVLASMRRVDLLAGDRLLLCSDGLTGALPESCWSGLLGGEASPAEQVRQLVDASLANQASDNVSVVLLTVL